MADTSAPSRARRRRPELRSNPPRILDLFSKAGGAAMGYHRAGLEVIGVDHHEQPRYPFPFYKADALGWLRLADLNLYDAIHASPPCQAFIRSGMFDHTRYTDLLTPTRALLDEIGLPYVIENVPGAPMRPDLILCGTMFGLGANGRQLRRHRWFEANWPLAPFTLACSHHGRTIGVYGHPRGNGRNGRLHDWGSGRKVEWDEAMGIDWMRDYELSQAIPPAYTEFIGVQLVAYLTERREVAATG
jgi:DNA (cytosine-5)-methyltransferase 1